MVMKCRIRKCRFENVRPQVSSPQVSARPPQEVSVKLYKFLFQKFNILYFSGGQLTYTIWVQGVPNLLQYPTPMIWVVKNEIFSKIIPKPIIILEFPLRRTFPPNLPTILPIYRRPLIKILLSTLSTLPTWRCCRCRVFFKSRTFCRFSLKYEILFL